MTIPKKEPNTMRRHAEKVLSNLPANGDRRLPVWLLACLKELDAAEKEIQAHSESRQQYMIAASKSQERIEELQQRVMSAEFDKAERDKRIAELKAAFTKAHGLLEDFRSDISRDDLSDEAYESWCEASKFVSEQGGTQ